eukprot:CAMPEP_0174297346 /NCGR_PEP_ID=MMETSP0809-20121228/50763_1 /TAXON_ID=73025 ORGANISM="Eutreptiella gymnastica-like, Strain CCMP1594" /NCGR_SAMPLE_ID=MMETSP0809 /ASSEMBLY_ACC=CAM_ASM_000658 /LENGTH=66 /DNA_ID=CAMNT_0015401093 /DNA_START=209 /DNA_END=409 /DNA_ORIENTATION=-
MANIRANRAPEPATCLDSAMGSRLNTDSLPFRIHTNLPSQQVAKADGLTRLTRMLHPRFLIAYDGP